MHAGRTALTLTSLLVLAGLGVPHVSADEAWNSAFTSGTTGWFTEYGTPQHDPTNGHPGGALKVSNTNYGIRKSVGWGGEWPLFSVEFRVESTAGRSGFEITVDYTATDESSTGAGWVRLAADGSNAMTWGNDYGSWPVYAYQDGVLQQFRPAANQWYQVTLAFDQRWSESGIWIHMWLDWCECWHEISQGNYNEALPIWRMDRVHVEGIYAGTASRNIYLDNARPWEVYPITAPSQPGPLEARMGPDPCPSSLGDACALAPFEDGLDSNDVALSWWPPYDLGHAAVREYRITRTGAIHPAQIFFVPPEGPGLQHHVDRDLPADVYTYTVVAVNIIGPSPPSEAALGWSTGVNGALPDATTPTIWTTADDSATFHFGFAGATASLRAPGGEALNVVFTGAGTAAAVATVGFDGNVRSARDANGGPMSASAFQVTCTPRVFVVPPCLVNVGADGTWRLESALNDAARPAGSLLRVQGLTFDDWASGSETSGTGHDARFSGAYVRHWNWHEQARLGQPLYEACTFACHVQGPPQESLEFARALV